MYNDGEVKNMNVLTFSTGTIKLVMNSGDKISLGKIEYEKLGGDKFEYIITPYWDIVDGLPAVMFSGISGIDLEAHLDEYICENVVPAFLEEEGNLIVESCTSGQAVKKYKGGDVSELKYGDKVIIEDFSVMGETASQLKKNIFDLVVNGVEIAGYGGKTFVDASNRPTFVSILALQRMMDYRDGQEKRRAGIERAKLEGKYQGRKPIAVDQDALKQVAEELEAGKISVKEAMERTGITSRSTFYRKLKTVK